MENFFKTYEIKNYASFDKTQNLMSIMGTIISYSDLDCFEFHETIEVGTETDLKKELYQYIFAPVIPITEILDENSTKRGIYICTQLSANIWIKNVEKPIYISFLTKGKPLKIKSDIYNEKHNSFEDMQESLNKVMFKLYGSDSKNILEQNLKKRKLTTNNDNHLS